MGGLWVIGLYLFPVLGVVSVPGWLCSVVLGCLGYGGGMGKNYGTKVQKSSYMELFSKIKAERFGWFSNVQ